LAAGFQGCDPVPEGLRFCPLIKETCIGAKCAFWVEIWGRKTGTTEPVLDSDCAIVWNITLGRESLVEMVSLTSSVDKATSENARSRVELERLRTEGIPFTGMRALEG
jgi:hypothetical protein